MSFTDYSIPEKGLRPSSGPVQFSDVSLHNILKEELKSQQGVKSLQNLVVRCESLPVIFGEPALLRQFMHHLVKMILSQGGASPVFLHVHCQESRMGLENPSGYHICFQSNLAGTATWKSSHRNDIAICQQIISLHGGSFEVNNINNKGTVFSLILPGKLH